MDRSAKIALALGIAVVLHAGLVVLSLAPGVQGLADADAPAASPATRAEDQRLDVGWNEPAEPMAEPVAQPLAKTGSDTQPQADAKPDAKTDAKSDSKSVIAVAAAAAPAAPSPPAPTVAPKPLPTPPAPAASVAAKAPASPLSKPPAAKPAASAAVSAQSAAATRLPAVAARSGAGDVASAVTADVSYANRVRQHLGRFAGALPPGATGEARVQFVVLLDGRVDDVRLVQRSGHPGLDALTLDLPRRAQPLPLPGAVPQRLEVPVQAAAALP